MYETKEVDVREKGEKTVIYEKEKKKRKEPKGSSYFNTKMEIL